eukprot:603732-Amphidinium_carterae.1
MAAKISSLRQRLAAKRGSGLHDMPGYNAAGTTETVDIVAPKSHVISFVPTPIGIPNHYIT